MIITPGVPFLVVGNVPHFHWSFGFQLSEIRTCELVTRASYAFAAVFQLYLTALSQKQHIAYKCNIPAYTAAFRKARLSSSGYEESSDGGHQEGV